MIRGIGIDSVSIARFKHWHNYSNRQLSHVFHETEIDYCKSIPIKTAERLAVRFAAKEAFYKALSATYPLEAISLLKICKSAWISNTSSGQPHLIVNWKQLALPSLKSIISLTHTASLATAIVLLFNDE